MSLKQDRPEMFGVGRILTTKEAAALLNVNPRWLEQLRQQGKGPDWFRVGNEKNGIVRYAEADLMRWLEQRRKRVDEGEAVGA